MKNFVEKAFALLENFLFFMNSHDEKELKTRYCRAEQRSEVRKEREV